MIIGYCNREVLLGFFCVPNALYQLSKNISVKPVRNQWAWCWFFRHYISIAWIVCGCTWGALPQLFRFQRNTSLVPAMWLFLLNVWRSCSKSMPSLFIGVSVGCLWKPSCVRVRNHLGKYYWVSAGKARTSILILLIPLQQWLFNI